MSDGVTSNESALYRTREPLGRRLTVRYPVAAGRLVLRTEQDWDRDLEAVEVSADRTTWTFELSARQPFLLFKPCLRDGDRTRWSVGANQVVLMTAQGHRVVHPHFEGSEKGTFSDVIALPSRHLGRDLLLRAYLPPGYADNTLHRYPVIYMQDGKNLFFPEEAFLGREWRVDEALDLLDSMNAIERVVVIGLHSRDRMTEYTQPGYEAYGRAVVEEVVPEVLRRFRLIGGAEATGVMGSSLGGVVSFYMAWQYPQVFGSAACLSSTFSHRDDLIERVLAEPRRDVRFYLDSGWPGDNFEVTAAMAVALGSRGWTFGQDLVHLAFPLAEHDEEAWGSRLHLPLQFLWGRIASALRQLEAAPRLR